MPRTGSTSLQEVLAGLRPGLEGAGILYPAFTAPGADPSASVNHQYLGEVLDARRPRSERAPALARFSKILAATRADTVILSYEDFSVQRPGFGVPETLRAVLAREGFALDVLMTVKAPFEFLNSAYAHRAQLAHEADSFRDYTRRYWTSGRLNYPALIAPWARAAGGRIAAVPLRDARSDAPLVRRMIAAMGLSDRIEPLMGPDADRYATNRSSGPLAVEASRRLRRMRAHLQVAGHPRQIGHVVDAAAWSRGLDAETFRGDAPEMRARIAERYAGTCERFARDLWGQSWEAVARPATERPPNEWANRPIPPETERQIERLVQETVAHFGFRAPPAWRRLPVEAWEGASGRLTRMLGRESRWRIA